jgi:hypothetical protein
MTSDPRSVESGQEAADDAGGQWCCNSLNERSEINSRIVVRPIGDATKHGERYASFGAYLRNGSTFHFDSEQVGEAMAQLSCVGLAADESIPGSHESNVNLCAGGRGVCICG